MLVVDEFRPNRNVFEQIGFWLMCVCVLAGISFACKTPDGRVQLVQSRLKVR